MKISRLTIVALLFVGLFVINANGQTCSGGKINGIYYTSCFPWQTGDGTIRYGEDTVHNDTGRLQDAIDAALGKLVFNEDNYYIDGPLTLHSYRIIEGTGKSTDTTHQSSKIIQTGDAAIFSIGENIYDVSIRDIVLIGAEDAEETIGILAAGGAVSEDNSSLYFQFSNLKFSNLDKGIFVTAQDTGYDWQFDNVRLDHSTFSGCRIGIHINSYNSGWNMSDLNFLIDAGDDEDGVITSTLGLTYGIFLERSTYTTMNLLVGNGPFLGDKATAFIKVKDHGNLNIQNSVAEGFYTDIKIDGNGLSGRSYPINLMNNVFLNKLILDDSTVVSIANQFGFGEGDTPAIARGYSQIYSIGDKFCFEGAACEANKSYTLQGNAQMIFSTNKYKNTTSVKTEMNGNLTMGAGKTITLGSIERDDLLDLDPEPPNGTLYYCSDCSQSSGCGSGSGALAKRLGGSWVCN